LYISLITGQINYYPPMQRISILNQSIITSSDGITRNIIRYTQQLSYRIFSKDSPSLPSSMRGFNYQPYSAFQYTILPYRSTSGNNDLVISLQTNLPTGFSNMISPVQLPLVVGSDNGNNGNGNTSNDPIIDTSILIGVISGVVVLILLIAIYCLLLQRSKKTTTGHDHTSSIPENQSMSSPTTPNNVIINNNSIDDRQGPKETPISSTVNPLGQFLKKHNKQDATSTSAGPSSFLNPLRRRSLPNSNQNNNKLHIPEKNITFDDPSSYDGESQYTNTYASLLENDTKPHRQQQQQRYNTDKREDLTDCMLDNYSLDIKGTRQESKMTITSNSESPSYGGDVAADGSVATPPRQATGNNQGGSGTVISEAESSAVSGYTKYTYHTVASEEYVIYAPSGKLGIVVDNPEDDSGPIIYAIKETSPLLDSQLNVGDRLGKYLLYISSIPNMSLVHSFNSGKF
jgi:hypothetical protein